MSIDLERVNKIYQATPGEHRLHPAISEKIQKGLVHFFVEKRKYNPDNFSVQDGISAAIICESIMLNFLAGYCDEELK